MNNISPKNSLSQFSQSLSILQSTKSDLPWAAALRYRIQLIIPYSVVGKEDKILQVMHSVAAYIRTQLPENWELIGYGPCSPAYKTDAFTGEGVDVILHRRYSPGCTITRFQLLPDLSLKQIGK